MAIALLLLAASPLQAQGYPTKPIRLIVPFAPAGAADIIARGIMERMQREVGQPLIIVNRDGAGTIIGVDMAAKSAPDGYTLLVSGDAGVINAASGRKLPYDLLRDLTPISLVFSGAQILLVKKDSPFNTLQDLVKYAKANPGRLRYGSTGVGTAVHLSTEILNQAAGIKTVHVPYKGVAPAMNDVAGGHVDFVIAGSTAAIPAIKNGQFKALAIMSKTRSRFVPEVPTAMEQGVPADTGSWYGLFAPAGTSADALKKIHAALVATLASSEVAERFKSLGGEPVSTTSEEFTSFLRAQLQRYSVLMRQLDIQLD